MLSHPLTDGAVDAYVTRTSPGTYSLGYVDGDTFVPFYVGRSDSDLNHRLHSWVGVDSRSARWSHSGRAAYGLRFGRPACLPLGSPALRCVGVVADASYTHFEFHYAVSAEAAFLTECENYHGFGGSHCLDNERHPRPPEGTACACPVHGHRG